MAETAVGEQTVAVAAGTGRFVGGRPAAIALELAEKLAVVGIDSSCVVAELNLDCAAERCQGEG